MAIFTACVILPACLANKVEPERHSLYYVYTALSKAVSSPGIFEFTAMGLLDDRKIDYYNSVDKKKIPEQKWMKEKLSPDYWEKGTQSRKSKEQWFKVNVNILMERMRHNGSDIHSLMWRHGCEANKMPDGSLQFVRGVDEYSYDGMDFLSFDDNSMQWVAPVSAAVQTKRKWDGVPILNQYTKGYLEKECVEWLDKFQRYGDIELAESLKSYPPKVHLFAKNGRPSGEYTLTCMATGFYPKDIKMSILKNDWPEKDGHDVDVLPNGDGTHQLRVTVEAKKAEIHMYKCKVEHRTLEKPIVVDWVSAGVLADGESSAPAVIAGVVAGLLLIAAGVAVCVVVVIGKKKGWFGKRDSDEDSGKGSEEIYENLKREPVTKEPKGSPEEQEPLTAVTVYMTQQGEGRRDGDEDSGQGSTPSVSSQGSTE